MAMPDIPRFSALLLALFAFLILTPLLPLRFVGLKVVDVTVTVVLIVGSLSVERRRLVRIAWALAIPALGSAWILYFYPNPALLVVGLSFRSAFLLLLAWVVLRDVLNQREVTGDTLAGAACGYLILGVLWAGFYAMLETLKPGSIVLPEVVKADESSTWFTYFSFVTITTLGYGDITPVTTSAGMLAAIEALVGQLYIAVLIARLVGLHAMRD
jgi:hypothetical protein